ncbi:hypothetical protein [Nonomuraea sp. NPDC048826]|uniref:hypothetical protein n=1 Tax=Nonomuraea sp. NPDC048826 TaxID=3364347 RepID=UPI00371F9270
MRNISRFKKLATVIGVSASLAALAPAPALAAAASGCSATTWGKLTTSGGYVSYNIRQCGSSTKAWGSVVDTKSDVWTAVVEVDFYADGKAVDGGYKEAGRKKGSKTFSYSSGRVDIDKVRVRARRCLPSTIVCNNTKTKTVNY